MWLITTSGDYIIFRFSFPIIYAVLYLPNHKEIHLSFPFQGFSKHDLNKHLRFYGSDNSLTLNVPQQPLRLGNDLYIPEPMNRNILLTQCYFRIRILIHPKYYPKYPQYFQEY